MREPFLQKIEKRVIVGDGAMGTMLYARGIPFSRCYDELNLTHPHLVKDVHLGYVKAGAEVIETNTFGANRSRLEKYELGDKVREINLAGVRLAREVAGEDLYVAGAVGPLGIPLEPLGPTSFDEARAFFRQQIEALAEGGADLIVIETMIDVQEARQALLAARDSTSLPVIVQMTIREDGATPTGAQPEYFTRQLDAWGADIIGLNCSVGPAVVLERLERMAKVTARKLAAQPNAGMPRTVDGRSIYLCSPEYMADYARRFIAAGARLVGGCCGTTPEHIRAIKAAARSLRPQPPRTVVDASTFAVRARAPVPVEARSSLASKLTGGGFPVLVEVVPPKGCDPTREIEGGQYLRGQGVDAVNISDGSGATARMSAQTLAAIIQQRAGMEVLLHYSCIHRNVLSIQSDLLGAYALGLRNILAVTGDAPAFVEYPSATTVRDVDDLGLVNVLANLNRGLDVGGNPLGAQTGFLIGVEVNPYALDMEAELRRFESKVRAGANFALVQPVFDAELLGQFLERLGGPATPIIAGLHPLTSLRHAEYMNNEVPGVSVPPAIMDRMRAADTGDKARAEGVAIARELLLKLRPLVQGVQIASPFGRYAMAVEVAEVVKRPSARDQDSASEAGGLTA
jgi:homocysteine S-methyltransferase